MAHVHNFATQDFPTTVSRGVELLAESWEPESVCLLDIPMLATRERLRYFRDRIFEVRGFGIMGGAGGGLGHDVTVPGSHVIIGGTGNIIA